MRWQRSRVASSPRRSSAGFRRRATHRLAQRAESPIRNKQRKTQSPSNSGPGSRGTSGTQGRGEETWLRLGELPRRRPPRRRRRPSRRPPHRARKVLRRWPTFAGSPARSSPQRRSRTRSACSRSMPTAWSRKRQGRCRPTASRPSSRKQSSGTRWSRTRSGTPATCGRTARP